MYKEIIVFCGYTPVLKDLFSIGYCQIVDAAGPTVSEVTRALMQKLGWNEI